MLYPCARNTTIHLSNRPPTHPPPSSLPPPPLHSSHPQISLDPRSNQMLHRASLWLVVITPHWHPKPLRKKRWRNLPHWPGSSHTHFPSHFLSNPTAPPLTFPEHRTHTHPQIPPISPQHMEGGEPESNLTAPSTPMLTCCRETPVW